MKIVTILGSPRTKGNTDTVLAQFEQLSAERHQIDRINITAFQVNGCLGCNACQAVKTAPGCIQDDDALSLFERLLSADAVVYASPLYCWGFSAQLKALIDRHYCLVKDAGTPQQIALMAGKPTMLLVTCAGPVEGNADLIQTVFERMNQYISSRIVGQYVVPLCTTPDALGDQATGVAQQMASDIATIG